MDPEHEISRQTESIDVDPDPLTDDYREVLFQQLEGHDDSAVSEVRKCIKKWSKQGYSTRRVDTLRNAVSALVTGSEHESGVPVSEEVIGVVGAIIAISRNTVRDEFGDLIRVYRGVSPSTIREYGAVDEESRVVRFPGRVFESWTTVEWIADEYGEVTVQRDVPISAIAFFGPLLGGRMSEDEEITVAETDMYPIPFADIEGHIPR